MKNTTSYVQAENTCQHRARGSSIPPGAQRAWRLLMAEMEAPGRSRKLVNWKVLTLNKE